MKIIPSIVAPNHYNRNANCLHHSNREFADQRIFHKSFSSLTRPHSQQNAGASRMAITDGLTSKRLGSGRALIYTRKCARTERLEKENKQTMKNIFCETSPKTWQKPTNLQLIKRIKNKMEQSSRKDQINNILNQILQRESTLLVPAKTEPDGNNKEANGKDRRQLWSKKKMYNCHANKNGNILKRAHFGQFQKHQKSRKVDNQFSGWTKGSLTQFQSLDNSFMNSDRIQPKNL